MNKRSLWREPLLHFLLIGLLLFLLYDLVAPPSQEGSRITVDQAAIATLAQQFTATWSRAPTTSEMDELIKAYVRDEVMFREGVALGLAKDDAVIKRRVRQKLEVLAEEEGGTGAPTDAQLGAYLSENADKFRRPAVLSLQQVLFDPDELGNELESTLAAALVALNQGDNPQTHGKGSLLPSRLEARPLDLVAREFGPDFANALSDAPLGQWFGPVPSAFGVHLVRIGERKPGYLPSLEESRKQVASEWESDRRKAAVEANYQRLLQDYEVVIDAGNTESAPQ